MKIPFVSFEKQYIETKEDILLSIEKAIDSKLVHIRTKSY